MREKKIKAYQDATLSIKERVEDLIARMTPLEKACQLSSAYAYGGNVDMDADLKDGIGHVGMSSGTMTMEGNGELVNSIQKYLIENTRLGIPAIIHVETLNGASIAEATSYPIPIGLAASWDTEGVYQMASQIKDEMTASGLKMALAPVIDICRDPRWGRMGETYGENPTLTSAMGSAYISGIQGDNPKNGMAACAKHFLGYGASEGGLNMAGAHLGNRELREVHAKPFAAAIQDANLIGVMNCYLALDGEPVTGSSKYLTQLLRDELGFNGVVVADYGSVDKLSDVFEIAKDKAEAGEMALKAGLDTETPRRICLNDTFVERLEKGEISMEVVDQALRRTLRLKFQLGLFENPYVDLDKMKEVYQKEDHKGKSYELACKTMTLLKNENKILPLRNKKKIAVIGPGADNYRALFGGYAYPAFYEGMRNMLIGLSKTMGLQGVEAQQSQKAFLETMVAKMPEVEKTIEMNYPGITNIYEGIKEKAEELFSESEVRFERGCDYLSTDQLGFEKALEIAKDSDLVLYICGGKNGSSDGCTMGENVDTSNIGLPGVQEELAKELLKTGTPMVVVHLDGKPLSSTLLKEEAAAILEAWHPGQLGAQAIADTLFGINNPCGKLPVTAVRHAGQIPIYAEQHRGSGATGRGSGNNNITQGYVDEAGFPLYPFGYGISYTHFSISDLKLSSEEIDSHGQTLVSCKVTNTGDIIGDEVVQLYFVDKLASFTRPNKELAGFKRVTLIPGESKIVEFTFSADQTAFVGKDHQWIVEAGEVDLLLGNSCENLERVGTVRITDTRVVKKGKRTYYSGARHHEHYE